jgi:signal peptidase
MDEDQRANLRRAGIFAICVVAGFAITLTLTVVASLAIGQKLIVIGSGSEEPYLKKGDVVIERQVHPTEADVGDLITFSEPGTGRTLTHRVRKITRQGPVISFVTQGDSSPTLERFYAPADGEIGVPVRRIPFAGDLADLLGGPWGLVLVPLFGVGMLAGVEFSRRRRDQPGM